MLIDFIRQLKCKLSKWFSEPAERTVCLGWREPSRGTALSHQAALVNICGCPFRAQKPGQDHLEICLEEVETKLTSWSEAAIKRKCMCMGRRPERGKNCSKFNKHKRE